MWGCEMQAHASHKFSHAMPANVGDLWVWMCLSLHVELVWPHHTRNVYLAFWCVSESVFVSQTQQRAKESEAERARTSRAHTAKSKSNWMNESVDEWTRVCSQSHVPCTHALQTVNRTYASRQESRRKYFVLFLPSFSNFTLLSVGYWMAASSVFTYALDTLSRGVLFSSTTFLLLSLSLSLPLPVFSIRLTGSFTHSSPFM